MRRILSHFAAVLVTVAGVGAIGMFLDHVFAGSGGRGSRALQGLRGAGPPPGFKANGPGQ